MFHRTTSRGLRPVAIRPSGSPFVRTFSQTALSSYPKKGAEDRHSINTESSEHTKSSTDDEAAAQDKAAYDPDKTRPESALKEAGKGQEGNPLEVSGANQDVSKQIHPEERGAEKSAAQENVNRSGAGKPPKSGR